MNTNLTSYKRKKKIQLLVTQGTELLILLKKMKAPLMDYKHFVAAKEVMRNIDQNEAFLLISLKKLKDELNEISG
jgi:hypothetical protein